MHQWEGGAWGADGLSSIVHVFLAGSNRDFAPSVFLSTWSELCTSACTRTPRVQTISFVWILGKVSGVGQKLINFYNYWKLAFVVNCLCFILFLGSGWTRSNCAWHKNCLLQYLGNVGVRRIITECMVFCLFDGKSVFGQSRLFRANNSIMDDFLN